MLKLALSSGLPLISVTTEDTVHIADVLSFLTNTSVVKLSESHLNKLEDYSFEAGSKYFSIESPELVNHTHIYETLVSTERTLIIINPIDSSTLVYNAGEVQVPPEMLYDFVVEFVYDEDLCSKLVSVLGGLTLKDVEEICRLCQTKYTELTPRGLMEIRRQYVGGMQGIQQIGTSYTYYKPPHFLKKWLAVDGVMFNDYSIPDELVPRGLMLSGAAGTGKTLGAKYLANSLGVPLYRLDLGALLGKYIGESEANLSKALAIADNAQPCVISHTKINTTVGDLDISEIYDRQELETFYCNTLDPETSLSVVTKVHRVLRKKGKKCLRITTNTGVIECTTDHKLLCVQDGLNVWVKAKDFKVGDDIIEVNYG